MICSFLSSKEPEKISLAFFTKDRADGEWKGRLSALQLRQTDAKHGSQYQ